MIPLKTHDYATVVSGKKLKGSGLVAGDVVYIASLRVLPDTPKDVYLQRIYVVTFKVDNNSILIPNTSDKDNGYRAYVIDPRNLEKITDEKVLKNYHNTLVEEYGEKDK